MNGWILYKNEVSESYETLRLVEAFQFTDKHGEVCPANWKKGSKTMKDNPVDSQEYFSEL